MALTQQHWREPPATPRVAGADVPLLANVESSGRRSYGRLLARSAQGGVVESRLRVPPKAGLSCDVYAVPRDVPHLVLRAVALGSSAAVSKVSGMFFALTRWRWAFCPDGPEAMRDRLRWVLGVSDDERMEKHLRVHPQGAVYSFSGRYPDSVAALARRIGLPEPEILPAAVRPVSTVRRGRRVRVDMPCRFIADGQRHLGKAYDLSSDGLFIASEASPPDVGVRVPITLPIRVRKDGRRLHLEGIVCWRLEATEGEWGGFGVELIAIEDGAAGRRFRSFVERLISREQERPLSRR